MPELFDLDRAFSKLVEEVSHLPGSGPDAAMQTGRRRRRSLLVATAAVVALLAAGSAYVLAPRDTPRDSPRDHGVQAAQGSENAPTDSAPGTDPPLLDEKALDDALGGWLDEGIDVTKSPALTDACIPAQWAGKSSGGSEGGSSLGWVASGATYDPGAGDAERTGQTLTAALNACTQPKMHADELGEVVPGVNVTTFRYESAGTHGATWLAVGADSVTVMRAAGSSTSLPDDLAHEVARLIGTSLTKPARPSEQQNPAPALDPATFVEPLGDWRADSPGRTNGLQDVPCLGGGWDSQALTSADSATENVGTRTLTFASRQQAMSAAAELNQAFARCQRTAVSTSGVGPMGEVDGIPVDVSTYDLGGGHGHGAVWVAWGDTTLVLVCAVGVDRPLPKKTANRVGETLARAFTWAN